MYIPGRENVFAMMEFFSSRLMDFCIRVCYKEIIFFDRVTFYLTC